MKNMDVIKTIKEKMKLIFFFLNEFNTVHIHISS